MDIINLGKINKAREELQDVVLGQIPDGTLTDDKLSDDPGQLKSQSAESTQQLIDVTQFVKNGELILPSNFPVYPFKIYREGLHQYSHNATSQNQHDWSLATNIYISCTAPGTNGLTPSDAISLGAFKTNLTNSVYGSATKFVLNMLDNVYLRNSGINLDNSMDYLIRSASSSGFTWILEKETNVTSSFEGLTWTLTDNIYTTTVTASSSQVINNVVNFVNTDKYGTPYPYIKKSTKSDCQNQKGSFFVEPHNGTAWVLWVNPYDGESISDILPNHVTTLLKANGWSGNKLMFENIGFPNNEEGTFNFNNVDGEVYFFNCNFFRGLYNSLSLNGKYKAYLLDCIAAHSSNDGLNYHTTDSNSLVVEVNCKSYSHGKHKIPGGNTTTHSNNCSTAHDGMNMLRVGGRYWQSEGPIAVDANDVYSISVGCQAYDILNSTTGSRNGFYVYDTSGVTPTHNKYFIECLVSGKYFDVAYKGTGNGNTYYLNLEGLQTKSSDLIRLDSWEDA